MRVGFIGVYASDRDDWPEVWPRMPGWQCDSLMETLKRIAKPGPLFFAHADRVGYDSQANTIAYECGYKLIAYPPSDRQWRVFLPTHTSHTPQTDKESLTNIVGLSDVLIFASSTDGEYKPHRKWMQMAERNGKPYVVIHPNGGCDERNGFATTYRATRKSGPRVDKTVRDGKTGKPRAGVRKRPTL